MKNILGIAICALLFAACAKKDLKPALSALEQSINAEYNPAKADSLIALSQEYAKANPDDHATNLHYLTRSAELLFVNQQKGQASFRMLNEAVSKHGKDQNLTDAASLMARMWAAYNYKSAITGTLDPDDIDQMNLNLQRNIAWIDTSLVVLEKGMAASSVAPNPVDANKFIQISEGYAFLILGSSPMKCSDLLMKAAGLAKTMNDPNKAIQLYYTVAEKLPPHPRQPTALFMMGFIYANDLGNTDKAKQTYEDFLKRYPKDELAESAKAELNNLGKTPEQILEEMNRKNAKK